MANYIPPHKRQLKDGAKALEGSSLNSRSLAHKFQQNLNLSGSYSSESCPSERVMRKGKASSLGGRYTYAESYLSRLCIVDSTEEEEHMYPGSIRLKHISLESYNKHGRINPYVLVSSHNKTGEQKQVQNEGRSKICSSNGDIIKSDASILREPITCADKKLLVLDLNGLLGDVGKISCIKRPYCDDFLKYCFERFHVGVWSSRTKKNVDKVVNFLMGNLKENLIFCWDQSHCTETGFKVINHWSKPLVLKELKKLWNKHEKNLPWEKGTFNETNTLLLDDSPYKALCNPLHTGIFPSSYTREDPNDNSLGPGGDIRVYLEGLVLSGNVQKYVELHPFGQPAITYRNPFWGFYRQVYDTVAANMKQKELLEYV